MHVLLDVGVWNQTVNYTSICFVEEKNISVYEEVWSGVKWSEINLFPNKKKHTSKNKLFINLMQS